MSYIDLNPLFMRTAYSSLGSEKHRSDNLSIKGWFPLYSTAAGVRGSIYVVIKLSFIGNENKDSASSAGVQFFSSSSLASNQFVIQEIIGFVEDLLVEDDPESTW